jgi:hypothetical protein
MKKQVIVFTDFDGCMHPFFRDEDTTDEEFKSFSFAPYFARAINDSIDEYDIKIVFSTSWRYSYKHEWLVEQFPESIRGLIVGQTPHNDVIYTTMYYNREDECRHYMTENYPGVAWFALDDEDNIYYTKEKLLLCPNRFKHAEVAKFKEMLVTCDAS